MTASTGSSEPLSSGCGLLEADLLELDISRLIDISCPLSLARVQMHDGTTGKILRVDVKFEKSLRNLNSRIHSSAGGAHRGCQTLDFYSVLAFVDLLVDLL